MKSQGIWGPELPAGYLRWFYLVQFSHFYIIMSLCRASLVAQTVKRLFEMWETRIQSLGQKDTLEKEVETHSSILAWEIHGQRNLAGYSPWGHKELDITERLTLSFPAFMG